MPIGEDRIVLTDPEGAPSELPNEPITDLELELLLQYKQFLSRRGYREAVYCTRCWGRDLNDGTEFRVQTHGASIEALIKCRCRVAYGRGGRTH